MGSGWKFHRLIELENQKEIEIKSIVINRYYRRIALATLVHTLNNKVFQFSSGDSIQFEFDSEFRIGELENRNRRHDVDGAFSFWLLRELVNINLPEIVN